MGLFDRNKEQKKYQENQILPTYDNPNYIQPQIEHIEDDWIWVEGYKGTDHNMQCQNNFQFELNKEYEHTGNIQLCSSGYHFCKTLADVDDFYPLTKNSRFFKVKALI